MNRKYWTLLAWAPMLALAFVGVRTALVWNQLPARIVSHFSLNGTPDGWETKSHFMLAMSPVVLVVVLMALIAVALKRKPVVSWLVLVFDWLIGGVVALAIWNVVSANLPGGKFAVTTLEIFVIATVAISLVVGLDWRWWIHRLHRKRPTFTRVIAEESHGGVVLTLVLIAIGVGIGVLVLLPKNHPPYWLAALIAFTVIASAAWTWVGFTYRFTDKSIEVRTLGIRLRTIPLTEVKDYAPERVNPLTQFGGWGVKGFGNETAYILGGFKVLRIRTMFGDVCLGHRDPERLAKDLDQAMSAERAQA